MFLDPELDLVYELLLFVVELVLVDAPDLGVVYFGVYVLELDDFVLVFEGFVMGLVVRTDWFREF